MGTEQESKVISILETMAEEEKQKKRKKWSVVGKEKRLQYYDGWG